MGKENIKSVGVVSHFDHEWEGGHTKQVFVAEHVLHLIIYHKDSQIDLKAEKLPKFLTIRGIL